MALREPESPFPKPRMVEIGDPPAEKPVVTVNFTYRQLALLILLCLGILVYAMAWTAYGW
jgi:hypothetical protein